MNLRPTSVPPMGSPPVPPADGLALPPEVTQQLGSGRAVVVLVRGPSGSGKSAIAARVAEGWPSAVVWASTRGSSLHLQMRAESASSETYIDLSLAASIRDGTTESFVEARDALMHWFDGPPGGDARRSLPKELAQALPAPGNPGNTLLVMDTWDGFLDRYLDLGDPSGGPGLRPGRLERQMYGLLRSLGLSLVLVSDKGDSATSDVLADVVFVTAMAEFEERLVRILSLPKVRGSPLGETVYPYTLAEGKFRYIPRLSSGEDVFAVGAEPDPRPSDHSEVWVGSSDCRRAFGPLLTGQVSLFESDPGVPPEALRLLTGGAALSTLMNGGNLLLVIPPDTHVDRVLDGIEMGLRPGEKLQDRLRILTANVPEGLEPGRKGVFVTVGSTSGPDVGFLAVREDRVAPTQALFPETTRFLRTPSRSGTPNLAIVSLDALEAAAASFGRSYPPGILSGLLKQDVNGVAAHTIVTGRSDDPLILGLRGICVPHVRLLERQGRVFVLGVRPWTPAHVLLPSTRPQEGRPYELILMS